MSSMHRQFIHLLARPKVLVIAKALQEEALKKTFKRAMMRQKMREKRDKMMRTKKTFATYLD
jgi:hypothetical protein